MDDEVSRALDLLLQISRQLAKAVDRNSNPLHIKALARLVLANDDVYQAVLKVKNSTRL